LLRATSGCPLAHLPKKKSDVSSILVVSGIGRSDAPPPQVMSEDEVAGVVGSATQSALK